MFLIALGWGLKKTIADDSWTEVLNKLAIYLLFPALIFSGMIKVKLDNIDDFSFLYGNFAILVGVILSLYFGLKRLGLSKSMVNTYVIAVFFGNVGYLGFPILSSLMTGSEGIVSMHIALYTLLLFTLGIGILEFSVHKKLEWSIATDALKNPLLFWLYFSLDGCFKILAISVLEAGMPIAVTPFILAQIYPMERELIALSIVISCFLSVLTLPVFMVLVGVV